MSDDPATASPPAKGYRRLSPATRAALANVCAAAATVAAVVAIFMPPRIEEAWLRLPALCALLVVNVVAWVVIRRLGERASPILRGGMFVALAGVSLVAAAMHMASGWASLAGGLGLLSAFALRAGTDKIIVRGRDVHPGKRGPVSLVFNQLESLAAALVVVLLVWHFVLEAFRIPSGSMSPTLSGDIVWGDRVFVDKVAYMFRDPIRWEPTVFRYPLHRPDPYVKRLIGLPGEELLLAQGDIYFRAHEGAPIELMRKDREAREVLWLPLLHEVKANTSFVGEFRREGSVTFESGDIRLGAGATAIYPKTGEVVDHDAAFGAAKDSKPEQYGRNICGDLRARLSVEVPEGGELAVAIVRDGEVFTLTLKPGTGACTLTHRDETGAENALAGGIMADVSLEAGKAVRVSLGFADGDLVAEVGDKTVAQVLGTPLLHTLRNRDAAKRLDLAGLEGIKIGSADPAGGRKARIELRATQAGASARVLGIDRDVYYVGRRFADYSAESDVEKPFGVKLGPDQYFVLGDNSPGSKDARYWIRAIIRMKDDTQITGGLDDTHQELAAMLVAQHNELNPPRAPHVVSPLEKFRRVAMFDQAERPGEPNDATMVKNALDDFRAWANRQGRGAVDFHTEGGGYSRVVISEIAEIHVQLVPYVERKLFVGRPFAVFLSPRGVKLIN